MLHGHPLTLLDPIGDERVALDAVAVPLPSQKLLSLMAVPFGTMTEPGSLRLTLGPRGEPCILFGELQLCLYQHSGLFRGHDFAPMKWDLRSAEKLQRTAIDCLLLSMRRSFIVANSGDH